MSVRPTRRGILVATCAVPVALVPAVVGIPALPVWLAVFAALVLVFTADFAVSVPPRALRVDVRAPPMLFLGEPADALHVSIRSPSDLGIRLLADLGPLLAAQQETTVRVEVGVGHAAVSLQPLRRGAAQVASLWLRWNGPLRLLDRERRVPVGAEIAISPNVRAVRRTALRFFADRQLLSGLKVERYVGDGSEFEALREYAPGLDPRALDWKASARHRVLLCREFRAERNHQVVLAVDTGRLMREPLSGLARLDHAINSALLLGYVGLRTGDRVGLFAFDERVRAWVDPQGGAHSFGRLLRAGARLDYASSETNFTVGLAELALRLRRRSLVVLLTDFIDTVTSALMLENLGRLARRHLLVFVALRDPSLDRDAAVRPRQVDDVFLSVAAAAVVRERDLVLRRVRRLGIHVVDARPAEISADLVNRYLEIKRRELV